MGGESLDVDGRIILKWV